MNEYAGNGDDEDDDDDNDDDDGACGDVGGDQHC